MDLPIQRKYSIPLYGDCTPAWQREESEGFLLPLAVTTQLSQSTHPRYLHRLLQPLSGSLGRFIYSKCIGIYMLAPHTCTYAHTQVCVWDQRQQECKYVLRLIMESTLAGGGQGHKELLLRFLKPWPPFSTQSTIFRQYGLVPSFAR